MAARNPFGHVDLRVRDLDASTRFYGALMPALGFTETYHSASWRVYATPGVPPETAYVAVTEDPYHRATATRIAFWCASREDVDAVHAALADSGARAVSGPRGMPYSASYYALYFEDPSGNRFEVYHRTD